MDGLPSPASPFVRSILHQPLFPGFSPYKRTSSHLQLVTSSPNQVASLSNDIFAHASHLRQASGPVRISCLFHQTPTCCTSTQSVFSNRPNPRRLQLGYFPTCNVPNLNLRPHPHAAITLKAFHLNLPSRVLATKTRSYM